ncbi:pentatricopeptide repeat-containing protein-like [Dorcoceras hygrometricum]|uniref:Pentatricopeptide repeat-containing protein-like n=1 Tax=Dorcoceras hygrometricum TaxID=472368 RepID=A0A2Z7DD62_9LAMI|nr:pentatricopeptide repeat-containing protein-like [Dorcoceras hygrometricum]
MASGFMRQFEKKRSILKRSGKKYLEEALYTKLFKNGGEDQRVREQLNQFLKSHKSAYKWEVGKSLKKLRSRKLYGPALKLSETMEKRGMNRTVSDQAIHLDLVAKSSGISAAETYFLNLPESSKNHLTYGALFNCYCKDLLAEKAVALFEKMKELNLELTSMPYNSLMTLYLKTGQPKMVPTIIQEMKAGEIMPDVYTYNVWMRALAAVEDIPGVERVIDEMKRDGRVAGDWTTYSNLASIYADAGLFDKANKALRELESKNTRRELSAYQFLITLYGRTGNLTEVYRIWRSLKLAFRKTANISYLNMIQVLVNLNDLPGSEKCFKEWACGCKTYDIRIGNVLIGAYLREGLFKNAEVLMNLAQRRGSKPNSKSWELYLDYYMKKGEIKSAVECVENAISAGKVEGGEWAPSPLVVQELMQHLEHNKDIEGAEAFLEILTKSNYKLQSEVLESLIKIYAYSGKKSSTIRQRIKMEKVELSEEGMKLLNEISDQ